MAINNVLNRQVSSSALAGAIPAFDSNANLSSNNLIQASTTTVRAISGTYTLTIASTPIQIFTGNASFGSDSVLMPLTSTLVAGVTYLIINTSSTDALYCFDSTQSNIIAQVPAASSAVLTCILNSGATSASWNIAIQSPSSSPIITVGGWTPTLTAQTPGTLSVSYSTQTGTYIRWTTPAGSSFVNIYCSMTATATNGTASGDMRITGLPFTASNNGSSGAISQCSANWTWGSGKTQLLAYISQSPIAVTFQTMGTAVNNSALPITGITTGTSNIYRFSLTYQI